MSNLSDAEREKLNDGDFVFWENGAGIFPIVDARDVKKAVSAWGRYRGAHTFDEFKTRLTALAKHKGFEDALPDAWTNTKMSESATVIFDSAADFSDVVEFDGEYAIRYTKLFQAGEYPDKNFAITTDELEDRSARFNAGNRPARGNHEHAPSIFDGELGELRATFTDGDWIRGKHAFPRWFNDILTRHPERGKLSIEFDRGTKEIVGYAHTLTPRVREAALAAFSAAQHEEDIPMTETTPAPVDRMAALDSALAEIAATFSGAPISKVNMGKLKNAHDTIAEVAPDACPVNSAAKMSAPPALPVEVQQQLDRANAQIRELQQRDREREAAHFSETAVTAKQLLPAETALVTAFAAALMEADQNRGNTVVSFSDGTTSTLMDMFRRVIGMRPAHGLTRELVPGNSYIVMSSAPGTDGNKDEAAAQQSRLNSILDMTEVGRKARTGK